MWVIFIGSIKIHDKNTPGGEIFKNQCMIDFLKSRGVKLFIIDIEDYKHKKILGTILLILKLLIAFLFPFPRKIILSKYPTGAYKLLKFSKYLNFFKKEILYNVIGGDFPILLKNKYIKIDYFRNLSLIIVEVESMVKELKLLGLSNVIHRPNAKRIFEIISCYKGSNNPLRLVFVSRIMPEKGVEFLLNSLKKINSDKILFEIDFFGPIDHTYNLKRFTDLIYESRNFARYLGFLDLSKKESYKILSEYDLFVFPTLYETEGVPGALIDAMIAGLPILVSDFKSSSEIVNDKIGYLFRMNSIEDFSNKLIQIYQNRGDLVRKHKNIEIEKYKYGIEKIFGILLEFINEY